jgi:pimeloyl-ACP methyl ester carboxylesterase
VIKALSDRFEVAIVELPGLNDGGEAPGGADVASFADLVASVLSRTWTAPLAMVGHSAGSVLAVRAAQLLDGQCRWIVSIEGNLTVEDTYLTGLAATYGNPVEFKAGLVARVQQLVDPGQAPASYAASLATTDARTLWTFGRDVARQSAGNAPDEAGADGKGD